MAHGDAAALAGLEVFPDDQDLRLGYENDNIRGDEIAAVITLLVNKLDASKLKVQLTDPGHVEGRVWVSWTP